MSKEEEPNASIWLLVIIPALSLLPGLISLFVVGDQILLLVTGGFWFVFYVSMGLLGRHELKKEEKESKHGS